MSDPTVKFLPSESGDSTKKPRETGKPSDRIISSSRAQQTETLNHNPSYEILKSKLINRFGGDIINKIENIKKNRTIERQEGETIITLNFKNRNFTITEPNLSIADEYNKKNFDISTSDSGYRIKASAVRGEPDTRDDEAVREYTKNMENQGLYLVSDNLIDNILQEITESLNIDEEISEGDCMTIFQYLTELSGDFRIQRNKYSPTGIPTLHLGSICGYESVEEDQYVKIAFGKETNNKN